MFNIRCSQRGCVAHVKTEPKLCPVCANPLLPGDCVAAKEPGSSSSAPAAPKAKAARKAKAKA